MHPKRNYYHCISHLEPKVVGRKNPFSY